VSPGPEFAAAISSRRPAAGDKQGPKNHEIHVVPLESKPVISVQVRELVEFSLREGDLGGAREFVGPQRALAGIRGHQRIQRSRPAGYQKEVRLTYELDGPEFILRIQGRIDGVASAEDGVLLEEIKTVQGSWDGAADPLHWAQAKVYGFIYATDHSLEVLSLRLTYLDLETGNETEFLARCSFDELKGFFESATAIYRQWVRERCRWCQRRDQSIRSLTFPFPQYRRGQRELAIAAYRVLGRGGRLFLEAPTGIGKTISVLFPAIKALGEGKLERIFYLTARTVGRTVAEKAMNDLRAGGLQFRSLSLTAKEKICFQPGQPCDPAVCPFARGYYDRNKAAMRQALEWTELNRATIENVAREHQVCPFELSLDLSVWVDAVIGDYNYLFDPKVYLRRHFNDEAGEYAFLVDEAHNLVDRAREMFSAELAAREVREVRRAISKPVPRCAKALRKLESVLRNLGEDDSKSNSAIPEGEQETPELDLFGAKRAATARARPDVPPPGAQREIPPGLLPTLDEAIKQAEKWLIQNQATEFREGLLELYFRLFSFRRTVDLYDERYVTIIEPGPDTRIRLFCLDPSFLLGQALAKGKAAIFFSATLTPLEYYRELLGGIPEDATLQLPSPFPPENLAVLIQDRIQTHYKAREETLGAVLLAVEAAVGGRCGNYLVYLPSYQYLDAVAEQFQSLHPTVRALVQRPGMTEAEREEFLAAFSADHNETLVGFAVMGGIFGEGIDLVGERLIGAIVVGVGLPQLCVERDLIRAHFQEKIGAGFDYAYTFPGMNRVLQATGRVIRSERDRGIVLLIDARFGETRYRRLQPRWWRALRVRTPQRISEALQAFWSESTLDGPAASVSDITD